jgi:hypothetical protein
LKNVGSFSVVNGPKGGSEVLVKLTDKGRDEIIEFFYSGKEKKSVKMARQKNRSPNKIL